MTKQSIDKAIKEIIPLLNNNHFYPKEAISGFGKDKECKYLLLYSPPILHQDKMEAIRKVIGDDWELTWFGNDLDEIHITKKNG